MNGGLDVGLRLLVLAGVAKGLCAAHETLGPDAMPLGIIHRDVSPDNVHIGYDGHVKVVDFGIAAARGKLSSTRAGEVKGKLAYLAPEQLTASADVTRKADVWSLGVMAWEVLAGARLFADDGDAATMWNVVHRPVPDIRERVPDLDPVVADAVMGCLRRDPAERIGGQDVARALSDAASRMGATPAKLAEYMAASFAEERRRVEAKLERTLSRAGQAMSEIATVLLPSLQAPVQRSRGWIAAVVVGVLVVGGAIGWTAASQSRVTTLESERADESERAGEAERAAESERDAAPEAAPAAETPSPAKTPEQPSPQAEEPIADAPPTPAEAAAPSPVEAAADPSLDPDPTPARRSKKRKPRKPRGEPSKPTPLMDSPY